MAGTALQYLVLCARGGFFWYPDNQYARLQMEDLLLEMRYARRTVALFRSCRDREERRRVGVDFSCVCEKTVDGRRLL